MIFIVTLITAVIWHFLLERLWLASIGSTLSAMLITLALASSHLNIHGDKFHIEILQLLLISFTISVLVGYIFKLARSKNAKQKI